MSNGRLVAGCQEVGLEVASARMYLVREHDVRVIHVAASPVNWPHENSMLSVMARVTTSLPAIPLTTSLPSLPETQSSPFSPRI